MVTKKQFDEKNKRFNAQQDKRVRIYVDKDTKSFVKQQSKKRKMPMIAYASLRSDGSYYRSPKGVTNRKWIL